jgi:RNA polymerase sigma-70 factor (ECF subfamily)
MSYAEERVSEAWRSNHAHLTNLAFGILGELGAAEDAVQEAFVRLVAADVDGILDDRGWLTVVTSRICFDKIRSAPRRREFGYEDTTLETTSTPLLSPAAGNPLDRITLDDEVRLALLVMLQRLSPAERVVFVLHDVFQLPFDTIAKTVGRPAPTCRQLARRARLKLEDAGRAPTDTVDPEHQQVTQAFIDACSSGNVDDLLQLLDPEVAGDVDLGPGDPMTGAINRGSRSVSANFLRYFGGSTLVTVPGQRDPLLLAFDGRRLAGIISLELRQSRVFEIHVLADPSKLALLDTQLDVTA